MAPFSDPNYVLYVLLTAVVNSFFYFLLSKDDSVCDTDFTPNMQQYIVWAIGGLGQTAFIHFSRANRKGIITYTDTIIHDMHKRSF